MRAIPLQRGGSFHYTNAHEWPRIDANRELLKCKRFYSETVSVVKFLYLRLLAAIRAHSTIRGIEYNSLTPPYSANPVF
jgi:hypothetical protein